LKALNIYHFLCEENMADNFNIKDGDLATRNMRVIDLGGGLYLPAHAILGADGNVMTVNSDGRGDIIQHSHLDSGAMHMHVDDLTAGTYRYIAVDISNTSGYPHDNTNYAHIEWLQLEVDGTNSAVYTVRLGFLENVDATNGDRYVMKHWSGNQTAGRQIRDFVNPYPNGWRMRSENSATHMISVDDTAYQTDVNLPSSLDPDTADTPSGSGDVVLEIIVSAGTIDIAVELGYHSH
jgi:hypothetical protein